MNCTILLTAVYNDTQHVIIKSNDQILYDNNVTKNDKVINFEVPSSCISNGIISLSFEYPEAMSPFQRGTGTDKRLLSIAFKKMVFEEKHKPEELIFTSGVATIDFKSGGNREKYITDTRQWNNQETNHRWSKKQSELDFNLLNITNIKMNINYYVHKNSGECTVTLNGKPIEKLNATSGFVTKEILLSKDLLNAEGEQVIGFSCEKAISPYEAGTGKDKRVLGIALKEITFTEVEEDTEIVEGNKAEKGNEGN